MFPISLSIAGWPEGIIWALFSALMGSWFLIGTVLAILGERKDRTTQQLVKVPVITSLLYLVTIVAFIMGITLWLSVFGLLVPLGQAIYVFGLIVLLTFAAVEFMFFIGLISQSESKKRE
jgi:hypothetical protein